MQALPAAASCRSYKRRAGAFGCNIDASRRKRRLRQRHQRLSMASLDRDSEGALVCKSYQGPVGEVDIGQPSEMREVGRFIWIFSLILIQCLPAGVGSC